MDNLPQIIGAIGSTGIVAYQLSQHQPVSVTSVAGVPVISSGAAAYGNYLLPIAFILLVGLGLWFAIK